MRSESNTIWREAATVLARAGASGLPFVRWEFKKGLPHNRTICRFDGRLWRMYGAGGLRSDGVWVASPKTWTLASESLDMLPRQLGSRLIATIGLREDKGDGYEEANATTAERPTWRSSPWKRRTGCSRGVTLHVRGLAAMAHSRQCAQRLGVGAGTAVGCGLRDAMFAQRQADGTR